MRELLITDNSHTGMHGLRTPREEIVFTALLKIHSLIVALIKLPWWKRLCYLCLHNKKNCQIASCQLWVKEIIRHPLFFLLCVCNRCSLQFDKKYVFDLHLLLVHGEKIEVKKETLICEEKLQEPQMNEKEFPKSLVEKIAQMWRMWFYFRIETNLEKAHHIDIWHQFMKERSLISVNRKDRFDSTYCISSWKKETYQMQYLC